jgi:hypothetical protein
MDSKNKQGNRMTEEQINAAIAEACGWRLHGSPEHQKTTEGWQFGHQFAINPFGKVVSRNSIPNYCNDLNAMHEAEKMLTRLNRHDFCDALLDIVADSTNHLWDLCEVLTATARQRAEAFLRTLGKWEEEG